MKNKYNQLMRLRYLFIGALLLFSLILRLHRYEMYPQRGATSDEYTYSFLGVSLLTKGKPVSWSFLGGYKPAKPLTIEHIYFPIVEPYFDHPPLYGLLVGSFALVNGQNSFEKIKLPTIRLVPIALSLATSLLLFLLAERLFGFKAGVLAMLIFVTTTTFVVNGRVVVSENLVAFWFILATYLFSLWESKLTPKRAVVLGFICGLSFLTQLISTALFVALLFTLLLKKEKVRTVLLFVVPFAVCVILYFLYGAYFDWNVFLTVNSEQALRVAGPLTFWQFFSNPVIINKAYFDGWYLFSFLCLMLFMFDPKDLIVKLIPLSYILFLVLTLTEQGQSGWYVIPLFPFMALAASKSLSEGVKDKNLFMAVFVLFTGLFEIHAIYREKFGLNNTSFRVLVLLLLAPLFLSFLPKNKIFYRFVSITIILVLLLGNAFITWKYVHPA